MKALLSFSSCAFLVLFLIPDLQAADLGLSSAGTAYAPLEVSKRAESTSGPLSSADRRDLLTEFKGLVAMGMRPQSYEQWSGRSMADCSAPEERSERWSRRCEIITAQCNGFYYFYPDEIRRTATLQRIEVKVHASESQLLDEMKLSLRSLFGREQVLAPRAAPSQAGGPVRRWETGRDVAYLFLDISENPAGLVRFIWKRSPLAGPDQVRAD